MLGSTQLAGPECEDLLRSGTVGRVAVCTPTGPYVETVTYTVVGHDVVFRTAAWGVVGTQGRDAMLAFQVSDHGAHGAPPRGWSVLVTGRGEVLTAARDLADLLATWPPLVGTAGMRHLVLRLPATTLSGSRTGPVS